MERCASNRSKRPPTGPKTTSTVPLFVPRGRNELHANSFGPFNAGYGPVDGWPRVVGPISPRPSDDVLGSESDDVLVTSAQFPQDRFGVFTEPGNRIHAGLRVT